MKKQNIIIILLLVLLLIILGGYWIWQTNQSQLNLNQESEVITSDIDTSDWLTYRNEEYGFSFKYPQDWVVNFNVEADNFLPRIIISPKNIIEYNDSTPLQFILVSTYSEDEFKLFEEQGKKVKNIDIAGMSAMEYNFEVEPNIQYRIIRLIDLPSNKWGNLNQIVYKVNKKNADLILTYDTVLTTLYFFDWQTYRNEQFGFEVKYPETWAIVDNQLNSEVLVGFRSKKLNPADDNYSQIYINIKDNPERLSLQEFYVSLSQNSQLNIPNYFDINEEKYLMLDDVSAIQFPIIPGPVSDMKTSILFSDWVIEINKHNGDDVVDKTYELMLNTLNFL